MEKRDILVIVGDGLQGASKLPNGEIKEKVLHFFRRIEELLDESLELEKLAKVAKQLTISVMDALNFKDLDLLPDAIKVVDKQLNELK